MYTGDITDTMIKQIDQVDGTSTVEEILVGAGLDEGFYEVRMGGDGNVAYGVYEVKNGTSSPYYDNGEWLVGDANLSGGITIGDASEIASGLAGSFASKDSLQASDANCSGAVTVGDASALTTYLAGTDEGYGIGTKKIGEKTDDELVKTWGN